MHTTNSGIKRMIMMATVAASTLVHAGDGARTDWFKDAGYGLFCHWHSQSVNADGSKKDYYTAVKEFDVNAFANQVDEAGAKFVIFTLIHGRHELAFPSAVMDSICPEHTSTQRDLYADMFTALNAKGIRMMFYWNMHATKEEPDWHDGSKWATDKAWFVQKQYDLVEEIGNRYGDKLAGWWLDHCYDNDPRLPADVRNWGAKFDFAKYAVKLRSGNTNRIVTFNFRWKFWGCDWGKGIMDYQAGEDGLENNWIPASRFAGEGGTQWFACDATDDPNWMHLKPGVIKPRYATERVISYIQNVISNQGVFAYNCAMYNNGKIAEDTMVQLRAVKKAIRGDAVASAAKPVSSGRILFLGNSITLHGPYVAWSRVGGCGMAASAPEKDYVHLLASAIATHTGAPLRIAPTPSDLPRWYYGNPPLALGDANVLNIADIFERNYATWENSRIQRQIDGKPDIVVLQFGENMVPGDKEKFKVALETLMTGLKKSSNPRIFVTSFILGSNPAIDKIKRQVCDEDPGRRVFVDLAAAHVDASGAAGHPGDVGMKTIADTIWKAVQELK